mmetsp:Transcript_28342/g.81411  ORF Transcript_28342/g.81411 Transcript_28342/m.81411 type:complete len:273 (-) Transcript_28342:605-1423(-)
MHSRLQALHTSDRTPPLWACGADCVLLHDQAAHKELLKHATNLLLHRELYCLRDLKCVQCAGRGAKRIHDSRLKSTILEGARRGRVAGSTHHVFGFPCMAIDLGDLATADELCQDSVELARVVATLQSTPNFKHVLGCADILQKRLHRCAHVGICLAIDARDAQADARVTDAPHPSSPSQRLAGLAQVHLRAFVWNLLEWSFASECHPMSIFRELLLVQLELVRLLHACAGDQLLHVPCCIPRVGLERHVHLATFNHHILDALEEARNETTV